jgi:hypothetical protein
MLPGPCFLSSELAKGHFLDLMNQVGANIVPSLQGDVDLVLGIKEPPMAEVLRLVGLEDRKRIWMVFSHTHKGQVSQTLTCLLHCSA